jgi:hypothetical protein
LENQVSESAHIYRLDDGRLRLTFVHSSPDADSATFLSELGDFARWQAEEWLKDHLHPTTDFDALLKPLENQTELNVAVGRILMQTHVEDGCLTKSPASVEDACVWLGDYQRQCFDNRKITIVVETSNNKNLKATACFYPSGAQMGSIVLSSELFQFPSALRISLLHELIHANLHATGKTDADDQHGKEFQAERRRLLNSGVYELLL